MRRILTTVVAAGLLIVGTVFPAMADEPTEFVWNDIRTETDPCTGDDMTVYFTFNVRAHEHENNTVAKTDMYAETSSGYIGTGTENIVTNGSNFIQVFNWVVENPDNGDRALIKGRIKFDLRTGEADRVSIETKCIGRNA